MKLNHLRRGTIRANERDTAKEIKVKVKSEKKGMEMKNRKSRIIETEQVTRGHNIVADGWAGTSNPHPHFNPSSYTQTNTRSI